MFLLTYTKRGFVHFEKLFALTFCDFLGAIVDFVRKNFLYVHFKFLPKSIRETTDKHFIHEKTHYQSNSFT